MKRLLSLAAFVLVSMTARSETTNTILLWLRDGAPGALGKADKDIPTLTPYFPEPDARPAARR